jgi:ribosomal protein S17E
MGRVRISLVKRVARELLNKYSSFYTVKAEVPEKEVEEFIGKVAEAFGTDPSLLLRNEDSTIHCRLVKKGNKCEVHLRWAKEAGMKEEVEGLLGVKVDQDEFSTNFQRNKEILKDLVLLPSKKLRNQVAGYLVRLKRIERAQVEGESA